MYAFVSMYICIHNVFILENFLRNCVVASPNAGTIRVSCDSSHQILVTVTCTNCNNPMVNNSGSSPVIIMGLDPEIMYTVKINLFDGDQVVMSNITVTDTIIVRNNTGKIPVHSACACVLN